MSTELPSKKSMPMTEQNADESIHNNIEKNNSERAGNPGSNNTNTLSKSEQSKLDNLQKYINIIERAERNPNLPDEEKESLRNQKQNHVNEKNEIENRGKYTSEETPVSPSDDYSQNNLNIQDYNAVNNPKNVASDSQIKLDQLKDDYGQSDKKSDSMSNSSEPTDNIKI
jgi:hypothetical protein